MGKNWFEDGDNWDSRDLDNTCLECGDKIMRASRVQGVCSECMNGSFGSDSARDDIDLGFDWSEDDDEN